MKKKIIFLLALVFGFWGGSARAGYFRDKMKERIIEKQAAKPAPVVTGDSSVKIEKAGDYTFSFSFGGMERFYKVHVPASYKSSVAMPLLFVLHGGGGDMEIQATDKYYKQISKSEAQGFIAVFPNGSSQFKSGKLATWNAGNCCGKGRDLNVDDVGFIREVFKKVSAQLNVDKQKVFAAGMSNGGMMSYRLACEASDIFKGIAAVAGTDNTKECQPKNPISVLHIHAKDDDHVQFNGGAGEKAFKDKSQVTEFVSVPKTVEKWVGLESCEAKPAKVLEKSGAYCERYKCKASSVQLCVTDKGKHSWPGGTKPRAGLMGGSPSEAISANDVMWDFFNSL
ncbi:alpha/beta hydrolase family esterase [Bdellovibrio sp. HCB209]|uniref:alpha/beta hydrolase family esterase n=1 Tax=Bdellovibrio sp. HCB209 TaxID=3394354 RepID=UPI0039B5802F